MSIPGAASPLFLATTGEAAPFSISRSLRFNSADTAYLNRTPSSASNRKTWTWSGWIKRSTLGTGQNIFGSSTLWFELQFKASTDQLQIYWETSGTGSNYLISDAVYRDPSAWLHIVLKVDTTQSTAADRVQVYVNGTIITWSSASYPSQNYDTGVNSANAHGVGIRVSGTALPFDGYLADVNFIDGTALDPTSFGQADANGVWQAKDTAALTFGTNGFRLKFADNSGATATTLGKDTSGNSNNWTPNNLSVGAGIAYSSNGSGSTAGSSKGYDKAFDGSLSTFCEPNDNSTVTFDFTGFSGGGIAVSSSLRMYLNKAGSPAAGHFTVNGTNLGGSLPGGAWLTIGSVSSLQTITFFHASGSSSVELYAVEVDSTILVDGTAADQDSLVDTPTNAAEPSDSGVGNEVVGNYATLNPLNKHTSNNTLSDGNLEFTTSGSDGGLQESTIAMSSGKFYFEVVYSRSDQGQLAGIRKPGFRNYNDSYIYVGTGNKYTNGGSGASYGATLAHGDVIGTAFDADNGTLTFYKNGVSQGQAFSGISGTYSFFVGSFGGPPTGVVNFGQRAFAYTAPSGYKALNTSSLSTPTIADGSQYFDTKVWSGTGSSQAITGYNFSPDFAWVKRRNATASHMVFDTIRTATKGLHPDSTQAEFTDATTLTAFNTDGFTLGGHSYSNASGGTYAGWAWDAGTSTVTNNDGSIASQVRANPSAGFSIVKFTGTGSNASVGHSLNSAPQLVILKGLTTTYDWIVWHEAIAATSYLALNANSAVNVNLPTVWNSTAPTNSVFSIGSSVGSNTSGAGHIAYCFGSVAGYSQIGSFSPNGTADNAFVYTGFRTRFILARFTSAGDWMLLDTSRRPNGPTGGTLIAQDSAAEDGVYNSSQVAFDFLSNGFKIRHNGAPLGDSGKTVIYYAVAENPFQANGGLAR